MSKGFSERIKLALTCFLLRAILFGLSMTYRVRWISGREKVERLGADSDPVILSLWHNRLMFVCSCLFGRLRKGFRITIMISQSKDGELGTRLAEDVGIDVVRGSASRGGTQGLRGLLRAVVKKRNSVYLLPDGSKGPIYEVKAGAIVLSKMTQAPILPISWSADRYWRLKSWDRMIIPKPFARIAVSVGESITVERKIDEAEQEMYRIQLQDSLSSLRAETDAYFNNKTRT